MSKRGNGSVDRRGAEQWRLRYRIDGKLYTRTVHCKTKTEAGKLLRAVLNDADKGAHVAPNKVTVGERVEYWLAGLQVGARTAERYGQLMRGHVTPHIGSIRVQKLTGDNIDECYRKLTGISDRTKHHVHVVLGTMLRHAVKKGILHRNPIDAATAPFVMPDEEVGKALGADELARLARGFVRHPLHLFVATAIATGARRNELLALRWADVDFEGMSLRIARAVEKTKAHGTRFKAPKTKEGNRTITIDAGLAAMLRAEREPHLRIANGIPDGAKADLSLLKLPEGALIFPAPGSDLCQLRDADAVTRTFCRKARALGFAGLRLHDLRHTHGSRLIARGVPITVVAARLGHTPEVLLRCYAHEIKDAEGKQQMAAIVAELAIPSA